MKDQTHCCHECGSTEVEAPKWVDLNTNEIGGFVNEHEGQYWCPQCTEHYPLKDLITKINRT